jgi:hypothetical protein
MDISEKAATIKVVQAVYGAVQGVADVTAKVQALVNQQKTTFVANNATLTPGKDPAQGHDKHFAMNYTVGSSSFAFACKENETVNLKTTEPRETFTVIGASYGTINPNDPKNGARDVTAIVQDLLDSRSGTEIKFKPTNELFGDPFKGPRKNFGMTYALKNNPSQRKVIASDENQEVTVK